LPVLPPGAITLPQISWVTGAVRWEEVLGHAAAWNVLVWFATLVALADGLARVGFVSWIAKSATVPLAGLSPAAAALLLLAPFFASHYLFASVTAHVAALLPVALAAAVTPRASMPHASRRCCATAWG